MVRAAMGPRRFEKVRAAERIMKMPRNLTFLACLWLFLTTFALSVAAEVVPVVRTKTETFHNVELISKTDTHAFLKHSRGVANVRQADLDNEALVGLGLASLVVTNSAGNGELEVAGLEGGDNVDKPASGLPAVDVLASLKGIWSNSPEATRSFLTKFWIALVVLLLALYLFYCLCVKLICEKAGFRIGWWIWVPVPIIQKYSLLKAAGMSWLWILAGIIWNAIDRHMDPDKMPTASLAVLLAGLALYLTEHIIWSVKISKARGKGVLTMICLIFPVTYPLAFLYLAFSGGGSSADELEPVRPLRLDPLPSS
jgi:hypothetical protein